MADNVLRGWPWEGTFASQRIDGSRVFVRAHGAPLRNGGGEITGIVIMAREATRRGGQRASDRIGLLERIGERLASSLELDVTLRQVAETLVPQFADHCFIDLLHGDVLIRRAQLHSRGWMPEPGTWALVGEPIKYPKGHFCDLAMSQQDTIVVADLAEQLYPGALAGEPAGVRRDQADVSDGRPADCARPAARRDEPGALLPDRARGAPLRRR